MKPSWHKSGHSAMSDRFGGKAEVGWARANVRF
jgi:hypothetical protein